MRFWFRGSGEQFSYTSQGDCLSSHRSHFLLIWSLPFLSFSHSPLTKRCPPRSISISLRSSSALGTPPRTPPRTTTYRPLPGLPLSYLSKPLESIRSRLNHLDLFSAIVTEHRVLGGLYKVEIYLAHSSQVWEVRVWDCPARQRAPQGQTE